MKIGARTIRIAIVGVGNCASALIDGIGYYGANPEAPGIGNELLGGYRVTDLESVLAFDIDARKVGRPLPEALSAPPNCATRRGPTSGSDAPVAMGRILDGVAGHMRESGQPAGFVIAEAPEPELSDVARLLLAHEVDIVVNYLPVGSVEATYFYAECALEAGCGFVNCIPVPLAAEAGWAGRFASRALPIIGDDIKSQFGATVIHRELVRLLGMRGARSERTYQLNVGGNSDFANMCDRSRLELKKRSKTEAVQSALDRPLTARDIHVGPSDFVEWLGDRKVCLIRLEARGFSGAPISLELRLEVEDSPNSAGVVVDAVRACMVAKERGLGGPVLPACAWCCKSPPQVLGEWEALQDTIRFCEAEA